MPYSLTELQEFLITDPLVRILIVEGPFDVEAWRYLVPINDRVNCVVYSIEEIEFVATFNGNRGAALILAETCWAWPQGSRVRFFLDADYDRHTGATHPQNVTLTDHRDMEAYALRAPLFNHLCRVGAGENEPAALATRDVMRLLLRPLGHLRIASAKLSLGLPFQRTFADGSVSRFFKKRGRVYSLKITHLIQSLVNAASRPSSDLGVVRSALNQETSSCTPNEDEDIVHGKDFVAFLAWYFDVGLEFASGQINLVIGARVQDLVSLPNLRTTRDWLLAS